MSCLSLEEWKVIVNALPEDYKSSAGVFLNNETVRHYPNKRLHEDLSPEERKALQKFFRSSRDDFRARADQQSRAQNEAEDRLFNAGFSLCHTRLLPGCKWIKCYNLGHIMVIEPDGTVTKVPMEYKSNIAAFLDQLGYTREFSDLGATGR